MNKIILVGHLGQDPELRYTTGGQPVCKFSVATSEKYKSETKTEWHNIAVFGPQAEACGKNLFKGRQVLIEGKITYQEWESKDKQKRSKTEILAQSVTFLSPKADTTLEPF